MVQLVREFASAVKDLHLKTEVDIIEYMIIIISLLNYSVPDVIKCTHQF